MRDDVIAVAARRAQALSARDWDVVRDQLHPAFRYTTAGGGRLDRDEYLDFLENGPLRWNEQRLESAEVLVDGAPERMVWAGGKLWITGRGADLYEVDPANGSIEATIETGASGIDLAVDRDALVVPTRSAETDVRGFPTMNAVLRVSVSTGTVRPLARPLGRVDVCGLVARAGFAWLADNTGGRLYRLALGD